MNAQAMVVNYKQVLAGLAAAAVVVLAFQPGVQAADGFHDVSSGNVHHGSINAVRDADVTKGCATGVYCPGDSVRRDQMASFLDRLGALSGQEPVVNAATARQAEDSKRLGGVGAGDILARLAALEGATGGDGATDTELVERVETLEAELAAAVGRIDTLESDLASSDSRIDTLEGDLADANSRIETLESAVLTLQEEHNLDLLSSGTSN